MNKSQEEIKNIKRIEERKEEREIRLCGGRLTEGNDIGGGRWEEGNMQKQK